MEDLEEQVDESNLEMEKNGDIQIEADNKIDLNIEHSNRKSQIKDN